MTWTHFSFSFFLFFLPFFLYNIYLYPLFPRTPQACGFRDIYSEIKAAGYAVYGLSADTPEAQAAWKVFAILLRAGPGACGTLCRPARLKALRAASPTFARDVPCRYEGLCFCAWSPRPPATSPAAASKMHAAYAWVSPLDRPGPS